MPTFKMGQYNAVCRVCGQEKDVSGFYLTRTKTLSTQCKQCHLEYGRAWRKANPEKAQQLNRRSRDRNYEACLERSRQWRKNNLQYDAFRANTYRARKRNQVPPWANLDKIQEIYQTCPMGYHVDHVIPLKGKIVSGLHVETNLQHLPAKENLKKRNQFYG